MLELALVVCALLSAGERQVGVPIGQGKSKPKVTLTAPTGGWTIDRMILVEGSVSDATVDPVVLSINGDRYLMRTFSGNFARKFPAASGKNIVTVMATNRGGTGKAQVTTTANVPPVPLKAILTSDTDGVYTDLHIWEPTDESVTGGKLNSGAMAHVYWANTESPSGGTFFLNEQGGNFDQPAYGPYLYV
ncbi:MAG: histidine kinase, partial [Deltaproteobacteria bacterium]|nr:histidine kinase [Deltaproteobacteria bacterium]